MNSVPPPPIIGTLWNGTGQRSVAEQSQVFFVLPSVCCESVHTHTRAGSVTTAPPPLPRGMQKCLLILIAQKNKNLWVVNGTGIGAEWTNQETSREKYWMPRTRSCPRDVTDPFRIVPVVRVRTSTAARERVKGRSAIVISPLAANWKRPCDAVRNISDKTRTDKGF